VNLYGNVDPFSVSFLASALFHCSCFSLFVFTIRYELAVHVIEVISKMNVVAILALDAIKCHDEK
jgi:hypothetical protein